MKKYFYATALITLTPLPTIIGAVPHYTFTMSRISKKGGLLTTRHNELYYGVSELARKYFTPSLLRNYPLVYPGLSVREGKAHPSRSATNNLTSH